MHFSPVTNEINIYLINIIEEKALCTSIKYMFLC